MNLNIAAGLLITGFGFFLAYLALLIYQNQLLDSLNRNHFRNSFPYNYYMDAPMKIRVLLYSFLAISTLTSMTGLSFFFISFSTGFSYILAVMMPLSLLSLSVSNLLSLERYKLHIISSAVGFFLFPLTCLLFSFSTLIPGALLYPERTITFIQVLLGVIGGILLVILINPKLMDWYKMEKAEENGKTYYVKPKINAFAFYEWIYLFSMQAVCFLLFLTAVLATA